MSKFVIHIEADSIEDMLDTLVDYYIEISSQKLHTDLNRSSVLNAVLNDNYKNP